MFDNFDLHNVKGSCPLTNIELITHKLQSHRTILGFLTIENVSFSLFVQTPRKSTPYPSVSGDVRQSSLTAGEGEVHMTTEAGAAILDEIRDMQMLLDQAQGINQICYT